MKRVDCEFAAICYDGAMKWIAISGSWRSVTSDIEAAVRDAVRTIITEGNGIICGGAAHVDHIALDEVLLCDPSGRSVQVFIPLHTSHLSRLLYPRSTRGNG